MRLYVVLALLVCGCVNDDLVDCDTGLVCPANTRCDDVHGSCATADQFAACVGLADGDPCAANQLSGFCDQGVCIKPGCGNHVVEADEACDDGNHTSGDGCSADCTSNESCGNGVLDVVAGEACDDGNLVSRDGCDSQCQIEPLAFDITGIEPTHGNPGWSTFDAARGQVVHFSDGFLWAFTGATWELVSTSGPTGFAWYQVVYDESRHRVVVIGVTPPQVQQVNDNPVVVYDWDETTWTVRATPTKAPVSPTVPGAAVYEPKTMQILLVADQSSTPVAYELGDDWKVAGAQPVTATSTGYVATYDKAREVAVIASFKGVGQADTLEWDGTSWKTFSAPIPNGNAGFALGFDGTVGVIAVGGSPAKTTVSAWNPAGPTWSVVSNVLPTPLRSPELVSYSALFDGFIFGGTDDSNIDRDDVYLRSITGGYGAVKLRLPQSNSSVAYRFAYDDVHDVLVALAQPTAGTNDTWVWDGTTWTNLDSTIMVPEVLTPITFDAERGAVIAVNNGATYQLGHSGWSKLLAVGSPNQAITYDPSGHRLFAVGGNLMTLGATDSSWHVFALDTPINVLAPTLAFDARDHQLVLIDASQGATYVLDTTSATPAWTPTVSPGPQGYRVVEDRRRGTVWFVAAGQPTWERIAGNWVMRDPLPFAVDGPTVYSASGDMFTMGMVGSSRVIVRRRFENASPIESCIAGQDIDGDGLSGCDDPDCYEQCGTCPPFVSCL